MERKEQIHVILQTKPFASFAELAERLAVSVMTIRRDTEDLSDYPQLLRVPGGVMNAAFLVEGSQWIDSPESKRAIGLQASARVPSGAIVLVDAGVTPLFALQALQAKASLTVVTYDLHHLSAVQSLHEASLIQCGGTVDLETGRAYWYEAESTLRNIHADIALLSCDAIGSDGSLSCDHPQFRSIKRLLIEQADTVILLSEEKKAQERTRIRFGELADIDEVITDEEWPPHLCEITDRFEITVTVAPRLTLLPSNPEST